MTLKRLSKTAIKEKAFERLMRIKENHSKVKHISLSDLEMQNYLKSNRVKSTKSEIQQFLK